MEVKPGYKLTEVGVIPEDWEVKRLGDVGFFTNGLNKDSASFGHGYPFVNLNDVFGVNMISGSDHLGLVASTPAEQSIYNLRKGDVLFIRSSVKPSGVGLTAVLQHDLLHTVFSGFIIRFRDDNRINLSFKRHCFYSTQFRELLISKSSASANTNINQESLKDLLLALPPLPEQTAIATALSDVDSLISSLDALIAKKKQIKQGAMQELLSGKRRLPGFSGEREVKRLGELFYFSGGLSASREQLSHNGYCYLHYGDIHLSRKTFIETTNEYNNIPKLEITISRIPQDALLKDGDIVFVDASEDDEGTSKHVVISNPSGIPFISGLHTIVGKSKNIFLDNLFKRYCFQSWEIKRQFRFFSVGTKVSGINKSNIVKVLLSVPPLPEQQAIATILSDMDVEITTLESRRDKTRLLKQGMMQELLTGRIRLPIEQHSTVSDRTKPTVGMLQ